jgi:hypothetical protein
VKVSRHRALVDEQQDVRAGGARRNAVFSIVRDDTISDTPLMMPPELPSATMPKILFSIRLWSIVTMAWIPEAGLMSIPASTPPAPLFRIVLFTIKRLAAAEGANTMPLVFP